MELLVVLIIWSLYCHFFVKPYEARKKKEVKKKKPLQMFLGMECSERLFLLRSEEIATFARE